jgi:hypothetical protein
MRTTRLARLFLAAVTAFTLLAGSSASAAVDLSVNDACGDAASEAVLDSTTRVQFEDDLGHVDLRSATAAAERNRDGEIVGLAATLRVCGAVSRSDGAYSVTVSASDGCSQSFTWTNTGWFDADHPSVDDRTPHLQFSQDCTAPKDEFSVTLASQHVQFQGDTLTITVPGAVAPKGAFDRYRAGGGWSDISAAAADQTLDLYVGTSGFDGQHLRVRRDSAG